MPAALAAARQAGVTRLAELTRLDRLGLPVWQAVRPLSRALSVHQGKGACDLDARLGALVEAVESDSAERFDAPGPNCPIAALPESERPPDIADFARDRDDPPPAREPMRWVEADDLLKESRTWLPFDIVSLDLSRKIPSRLDRTSNGVGAGATRDEALAVALQELIERDAVIEWQARGPIACTADGLDTASIPCDWFRLWVDRLDRAGILHRCYRLPSLSGTPVFISELNDPGKDGAIHRKVHGQGCHPDPEIALFKAVAEAIQTRATLIAGSREDLLPSDYRPGAQGRIGIAFGLPLASGMEGVQWRSIPPGPAGPKAIGEALARRGYDRIAAVDLAVFEELFVIRAFICGLGSLSRRRRPPLQ